MDSVLPEGPKSHYPFENELSWRRSAPEFLRRAVQKYGDVFHFRLRGRDVHYMGDPELVREVLVTKDKCFSKGPAFQKLRPWMGNGVVVSEGEVHKRQRRMLQPSFHHKRIEGYTAIMVEEAERAAESLQDGQKLDLLPFIEQTAFLISTRCMFDEVLDAELKPFFEAMRESVRYMDMMNAYSLSALWKRWSGQGEKEKLEAIAVLHGVVDKVIASRRKDTEERNDLLSMLISTLDDDGDGKGMDDQELRDQVMTLLVAGFDTVASSVTTCLFQLARHPDIEREVVEEMKQILGGRRPSLGEVMALKKTTAAFSEALRLYPPAWVLPRTANETVQIGNYTVAEKATVLVSSYVNQRNPKYFPDPEEFDIKRWLGEKNESLPKFAFFPFGAGSRVCVGEPFAWVEANVILATLLQRWHFEPAFSGVLPYQTVMSMRPKNGCPVIVRRRS